MLALVTAQSARSHDTDLPLLVDGFGSLGVLVDVAAWDDPTVEWSTYSAIVIRSTWDYHRRLDEFIAWLDAVSIQTRVWNPAALIKWNLDKRYLLEVARWGLPVVPTAVIESTRDLTAVDLDGDIVVKPAVGAGANGARRISGNPTTARAHAELLLDSGSVALVQPYLSAVDTVGETGIVVVGGSVSHAFGKAAILTDDPEWTDGLYVTEQIESREASPEELSIAEAIIDQLPTTAYARIDLLPSPDGPMVSEVELIEPSLFLHVDPCAARRAATVFASLVDR